MEKIQESQEEAAATIAFDSESAEYDDEDNTDAHQVELVDQITMTCEAEQKHKFTSITSCSMANVLLMKA